MAKLRHLPFNKSPRYSVQMSQTVLHWFTTPSDASTEKVVQTLLNKVRQTDGTRALPPGDALRLIVDYRRKDIWDAIALVDSKDERFLWRIGQFAEETWNHDPQGLEWFFGLDEKLQYFREFDVVTAMVQCQDFCTNPDEYALRQRIVSKITMVQPRTVQQNPTMWEFIVEPNLEFLERCLRGVEDAPLEVRHFDHLRSGAYEHFMLLRGLYGNMRSKAMWSEMKRFVEEGVRVEVDTNDFSAVLSDAI